MLGRALAQALLRPRSAEWVNVLQGVETVAPGQWRLMTWSVLSFGFAVIGSGIFALAVSWKWWTWDRGAPLDQWDRVTVTAADAREEQSRERGHGVRV